MSGAHARIGPSSLYILKACPASLTMQERVPPEPETEESLEGTVAHYVAQQMALGVVIEEGHNHLGVEVTNEMLDGAALWVDTVHPEGAFETPLYIPTVHADCWGTPDYWMWHPETRILSVWDYKFGHRYVEEFENLQMCAYASGLISLLNLPADTVVQLGIVQPRCYMAKPVRQWVTNVTRVMELIGEIRTVVMNALSDDAPCITGTQCIDCRARTNCKALQYATNRTLSFIYAAELNDPSADALGKELTLLKEADDLLTARREALAVKVEAMVRNGTRVPGWEMRPGQSRLGWNDPVQAMTEAASMGVNVLKPPQPVTPTQALSRKLVDQSFIDRLASRPPAAMKLAPVSTTATRKAFSGAN